MSEPTTNSEQPVGHSEPSTANSQPSTHRGQTGPKTPEGKKKSSLNALKHGLNASALHAMEAVEQQSAIEFEPYLERMKEYFQPEDMMEHKLVERIARCFWRLDRAAEMDRRGYAYSKGSVRPGDNNQSILKYERMVDIQLNRAIKSLTMFKKRNDPPTNPRRMPDKSAPPSADWERRMLAGRKK